MMGCRSCSGEAKREGKVSKLLPCVEARGCCPATLDRLHAVAGVTQAAFHPLKQRRRVLSDQAVRPHGGSRLKPRRPDVGEALAEHAPVAQRHPHHTVVLSGLHAHRQLQDAGRSRVAARFQPEQVAVRHAQFLRRRRRHGGVIVPDDLADGIGQLVEPGVVGMAGIRQPDLGVQDDAVRRLVARTGRGDGRRRLEGRRPCPRAGATGAKPSSRVRSQNSAKPTFRVLRGKTSFSQCSRKRSYAGRGLPVQAARLSSTERVFPSGLIAG